MGDENDPQKYIFPSCDFIRVPRWENDGLEGYRNEESEEFQFGSVPETLIQSASPLQRELASLLGKWVYESNMEDPMGRDMIVCMPASIQTRTATKELNLDAAQKHLIQAYQNRHSLVFDILGQIGYRSTIFKASKDARRFPDWKYLIAKLLQMNLGTDANVKHLCGDVAYVRGVLLEVGQMMAEPPLFGSPAYAIWHPVLNQNDKAERVKPSCAYCDKEEEDGNSSSKLRLSTCSSCKCVYYCSKSHQCIHWPVHKPDCLEKQGKPVPDKVRQKAAATLAQWDSDQNEEKQFKERMFRIHLKQLFEEYRMERPSSTVVWSYDCFGKRRRLDFPEKGEHLIKMLIQENKNLRFDLESMEFGIFPLGMEDMDSETRGLGLVLCDKVSRGKIIVLYERLFADHGNGRFSGIGIIGAFVVHKTVTKKERGKKVKMAAWKKVDEPVDATTTSGPGGIVVCNRYQRVTAYFECARALAKAVPEDVDLGIHDVKAQFDAMQPIATPFGHYMKQGPF